ncbi:MAG: prolyl oligopeptidase family serine peptidase [Gammaproteobacteria bacterium]
MNRGLHLLALPLAGLILVPAALAAAPAAGTSGPPPTPTDAVTTTYWGVKVADPYRWLENADSSKVTAWIKAQNAWTEHVLGSSTQGEAIAKRVEQLSLTSTQRSDPSLVAGTLFFMQQTPPQAQAELMMQDWPQGTAKVLVNPNGTQDVAVTGYWPAPNGGYVAYGTAQGGSEATTLHVVNVANGKTLPEALPNAGGGTSPQGVLWDADGKGFLYVRLPTPGTVPSSDEQFNAVLYHHKLDTAAKADTLAFGKGFSPVAEYDFASSSDGRNAAIMVHYGDGNPDYVYLRTAKGWKQVLGPKDNVRDAAQVSPGVAWLGNELLVISYLDAPRGKLIAVGTNGKTSTLVPQGDWAMHSVASIKGGFLVTQVIGPVWRVVQYDANGEIVRAVPLPASDIGIGTIASSDTSDVALITYSGWKIPGRWTSYDSAKGTLKTVFEVTPAADYSKLRSYWFTATSKDGAKIPITVVAMKGVKPNGKLPTILYAYGGYGIVVPPHFMGPYLAWLENGGIYALANIRGGGAYGEGWHEAGMLGKKQNDFDDFYAAAQALVTHHWTDTAHLGILGGSNGGLLMGAALTQHPDEYRAVASFVGIYDMLRSELWPNGRYNVSEYGTVTKKKDFDWLYAYSPLQHVKKGTAYPAVLLVTGVNDPRVAPWQSRKFAAALQTATSSKRPILLLTRMNEGHGVTASFSQRVGNTAAALTFFAQQLGLEIKSP